METSDLGPEDVESLVRKHLARVRVVEPDSLAPGSRDLEITAKEQCTVIALVEDELQSGPLLGPRDFDTKKKPASCLSPVEDTTLGDLTDLLAGKIRSAG